VLLAIVCTSYGSAPWPQYRQNAQHTSYVDQTFSSKFYCKASPVWKNEDEFAGLALSNNASYTFQTFNDKGPSLVSFDSKGDNSTIFSNLDFATITSSPMLSLDGQVLYLQHGDLSAYRTSDFTELWNLPMGYTSYLTSSTLLSKIGTMFFSYTTQQWANTYLLAVNNGTLLWNNSIDIIGDIVLSIEEDFLYATSYKANTDEFSLSAFGVSSGVLSWNLTFANFSGKGDLIVRADGMILMNTRPSNSVDRTSYNYYIIDPVLKEVSSSGPGSALVTGCQGNFSFIQIIGEVGPSPWYPLQISKLLQIDANGNTLREFTIPVQTGVNGMRVISSNDAIFATSQVDSTAYLYGWLNFSSNATIIATRNTTNFFAGLALTGSGDLIWSFTADAIWQVGVCSSNGVCDAGSCTCNEGFEGEDCGVCTNSTLFVKTGSNCSKRQLSGLGYVVIVGLPILGVVLAIGLVVVLYRRHHRHHGYDRV